MATAGIPPERTYSDKKTGATVDRPGLTAMLAYARPGDVIVVHPGPTRPQPARGPQPRPRALAERGVGGLRSFQRKINDSLRCGWTYSQLLPVSVLSRFAIGASGTQWAGRC